jgi:dienelactone hydrolase
VYFIGQVDRLEASTQKGRALRDSPLPACLRNETGERYDPEAAKLAWQRTVDFLEKHLKNP